MALYFIGLGLHDQKDISLKGMEFIKGCSKIYLESYTGKLNCPVEDLEKLYKKKISLANREMVEKNPEKTILKDAEKVGVAFLIVGDPLSATTHIDLMMRAKKLGIKTYVIPNASVISAVGITGLQVYKFGKVSSVPFPEENFQPETPYDVIKNNKQAGLHTLLLLDLRPQEGKYMILREAIENLLKIENKRKENVFTRNTLCIGCARLGSLPALIKSGTAEQLIRRDFGDPVHCLIVPGKMHFIEEEAFKLWQTDN